MFEETAEHSALHSEPGSGSQSDCGSQHQTAVGVDEKAASKQAASDELVRARNKTVRAHHQAPEAAVVPPFANPSGSL